jgi:hypothetical protein
VERCTLLYPENEHEPLWIVQSTRPACRKTIRAALEDAEERECEGTTLLVTKDGGRAVHFLDQRLYLFGSKEGVIEWVKRSGKKREMMPNLEDALAQSDRHDLVAWGRIGAVPLSDKLAKLGIRSGIALFDFGKQVTAEMRVTCTDETRAEDFVKTLRGLVDLVRAQSMAVRGYAHLGQLVLDDDNCEELRALPMDLLRKFEQGLEKSVIRTDQASVTLNCVVPVEIQKLRTEVETQARLHYSGISLPPFGELPSRMTVPSARELEHPPKFEPEGQSADVPDRMPARTAGTVIGGALGAVTGAVAGEPVGLPPPPAPASMSPEPSIQRTVHPSSCIAEKPSTLQADQKLTVVNIRKDPVLLFRMAEDGKLIFVQKLPSGEAADLKSEADRHWIAVFPDKPDGMSYRPKQDERIWLLR